MFYFIAGFFSFFIANILSPQQYNNSDLNSFLMEFGLAGVFAGGFLWAASHVNGHSLQMFQRSKADFFVNVLIASTIGVSIFVAFNYLTKYRLVGRWVYCFSICIYSILVVTYSWFRSAYTLDRVIVYSGNPNKTKKQMSKCAQTLVHFSFYPLKDLSESNHGKSGSTAFGTAGTRVYIVGDSSDCDKIGLDVPSVFPRFREKIFSLSAIVEKELEVTLLETYQFRCWWEITTHLRDRSFVGFKRGIDLVIVILLALPAVFLVFAVGIIVKMWDGGPIFYTQKRLGQYGDVFEIIKIRTMKINSEAAGAQWASTQDKRVTPVGRLLRMTRVDELPQLWNIACGQMALVGPRPERPEFYSTIEKEIPEFRLRLACKPGLTGWAQVNFPYGASVEDARMKLLYDLFYIKNAGFILEMRVITRTIVAMVKGAR
jgi:lipopolysaccharide/colanic/teichoic acid biosynthesis glycosyltransferase